MKKKRLMAFGAAATLISLLLLAGCADNKGAATDKNSPPSRIPESISAAEYSSLPDRPNG